MSGRRNIATGAVLGCSKTSIIKGVRYMDKPWYKQLFCKHAYKMIGWHFINSGMSKMNWYKCMNCGKETCAEFDSKKARRLSR